MTEGCLSERLLPLFKWALCQDRKKSLVSKSIIEMYSDGITIYVGEYHKEYKRSLETVGGHFI